MKRHVVLGVDPGLTGYFCLTDGEGLCEFFAMPIEACKKRKRVSFAGLGRLLGELVERRRDPELRVFVEMAKPLAMGSKFAFNYGRDFETLLIALRTQGYPAPLLVQPSDWAREMHEGVEKDLKAKAKSQAAVKKLDPRLVRKIPTRPKGAFHDGAVDALLIALYGIRCCRSLDEAF